MNKREIQFIIKETVAQYPPLISIKTDTSIDLTKKGELHAISLQTSSNLKNT